ncbi:hypothetical protein FG87_22115 [Nocardia vulneris]|uniref:HTH cro/C1-type domain-containing protein n=2 Tax=Nocardia vulneris TaxID=1141657 RepID=A0ABR4ZCT5_9NOCA|nr:hypothetical protein FG87_22115 [Nocardia vulneris]
MRQDALAAAADIPVDTLSKIERGLAAIDMEQLARIAAAFKLSPDDFIGTALSRANWHHGGRARHLHQVQTADQEAHPKNTGNGALLTPNDEEDDEVGTPSEETLRILRADAEVNPDS